MLYYIYKIYCDDCDYVYVGSTRAFARRKNEHKTRCNNENGQPYNRKLYQTIRNNGGWSNWKMVCIDEIDVENRRQSEIREEEARQKLQANLNMIKCYRTEEQKKEQDKEYHKEYYKEYYEENKDYYKEYRKEYYENNKDKINKKITCECGCEVINRNLENHKKTKKHQAYE